METEFTRYPEATHRIERIADPTVQAFVKFGLTKLLTGQVKGESKHPVDLVFVCSLLESMIASPENLGMIVAGDHEELAWFED